MLPNEQGSAENGNVRPRWRLTLLQLLIVIVVLSIPLMFLIIPAIGAARARAREIRCSNNLHELHVAWTRAMAARQPDKRVRVSEWCEHIKPFLEGGDKVFTCPEAMSFDAEVSYGMNSRAWRMVPADAGRIVLLDYNALEATIVGQTGAQLTASWSTDRAPRHFGKQNLVSFDGSGKAYEPGKIAPMFCDYYMRYWRPVADSNIALIGCVNSGEPPTTTAGTLAP